MQPAEKEKFLFGAFELVLILKIFNSIWQIILGFLIIFDKDLLGNVIGMASREILKGQHLFLAQHAYNILVRITPAAAIFIAIYFLAQGFLKIFLVTGLLKKILWVYPASIGVFFAFICYQMYKYVHSPSHPLLMLVLSCLDVITIFLVQHEYEVLKKQD
jgi:uncharacterized membrane protein